MVKTNHEMTTGPPRPRFAAGATSITHEVLLHVVLLQKLQVMFAVGSDGEFSEPLEVAALSCDTVDQVKDKILAVFRAKFGFAYNIPLRDIRLGGSRR